MILATKKLTNIVIPLKCSKLISIGKSSLTVQFVDSHFVESYYPTIENTFSKVIKYKGQEYATEIIDTAGQVRETLPNPHYIWITCLLFLFSICMISDRILGWVQHSQLQTLHRNTWVHACVLGSFHAVFWDGPSYSWQNPESFSKCSCFKSLIKNANVM